MTWRDAYQSGRGGGEPRGVARLVGDSPPMRDLKERIPRVAGAPFPVGDRGRVGHRQGADRPGDPRGGASPAPPPSWRSTARCSVTSCSRRSCSGHAKGAFTGAGQDRKGLLELSSGGTVLLDEVDELTPCAQAKLLRVLQDGEIRRLGENRTQRLDLRIVAATNRPLDAEAAEGRFRRDLRYRLNVVGLTAPLRERGPDVARLAEHRWKGVAEAAGSRATLARETVAALAAHPWPGNVRELQNVLANLTATGPRYGPVRPDALPAAFRKGVPAERQPPLAEAREDLERAMVRDALGRHRSVARAAGELGVTRQGLSKLMARLDIDRFNPGRDHSAQMPSR